MKRLLLVLSLLLPCFPSFAQQGQQNEVYQTGGSVTPGNLAMWATDGLIMNAPGGAPGLPGQNPTSITLTGGPLNLSNNFGNGPYNMLSFSPGTPGNPATISFNAFGGATPEPLECLVNGAAYNCFILPPNGNFYPSNGGILVRAGDRLFVGNGTNANNGNQNGQDFIYTATRGFGYSQSSAALIYSDIGYGGVLGGSQCKDNTAIFANSYVCVGTEGFGVNNNTALNHPWASYGGYFESIFDVGTLGVSAIGVESDAVNWNAQAGNYLNTMTPYAFSRTLQASFWAACGGGQAFVSGTGPYPCTAAFVGINNGNAYTAGLEFEAASIVADNNGNSPAVVLPQNYMLEWYEPATQTPSAILLSNIPDGSGKEGLIFQTSSTAAQIVQENYTTNKSATFTLDNAATSNLGTAVSWGQGGSTQYTAGVVAATTNFRIFDSINNAQVLLKNGPSNYLALGDPAGPTLIAGSFSLAVKTIAGLTSNCASQQKGQMFYVTDSAASPSYNAIVAGGGSTSTPIFCDGTNWRNH